MSRCFNSNCFCDAIGSNYILYVYIEHYIYIYIQINLSYIFGQFGPNCDLIYPPSPASGLIAAIIMNIMIIMTTCVFLLMETNMCHFHKLGHLCALTDVFFCLKYSAKVDASGSFIAFYTVHSSIILGEIPGITDTSTIPTIPQTMLPDRCFPTPWLFAAKVICGTSQVTTSMIAMDFLA